jgi:MFS transporter, DHA2 family, multidrug resistance protein
MQREKMSMKPLLGLLGVLIAAMSSEFNDTVTSTALVDIRGALGIDYDSGTWIESLYSTGLAIGMAFAPWCAVTFTLRRFTLCVVTVVGASTLLIPLALNLPAILILRVIQGFAGGLTIPLLMTTALMVLPPPIRLYGLALYGLTATFTAPFSASLAALWIDVVGDWRFVFLAALPLSALASVLVWYGMEAGEPEYERLRAFDWRGALLMILGFGAFTTMLMQGDRLDWFESPLICVLALISSIAIPLLLINEWFHPMPLLKLQMLLRRNFAYATLALFAFIVVSASSTVIPATFLISVQAYRPVQAHLITLIVALGQFVMLPAMALLLDHRHVDARAVTLFGLVLMLIACLGSSSVDVTWHRDQFYVWQVLQMVGQPMVVLPLLMMATNTVRSHAEGPLASALINTTRALAEPVGIWLIELIEHWRGALHSERLVDQIGLNRFRTIQARGLLPQDPAPLLPNGTTRAAGSLEQFAEAVTQQAHVLTTADAYLVMAALVAAFMALVVVLPERTFPPRILFSKK